MPTVGSIKKFRDGDIVFNEGDASGSAFVVVKGHVELSKNSKFGAVKLARLKPGELFGEMGVIDGSPRSATARCVGPTTIKEIPPQSLLEGIRNDPDLSSKVMGKLVERLRTADEMLARAGVSPADGSGPTTPAAQASGQASKKKGFFSRLFNTQKGREATFEILVADLLNDEDKKATSTLFKALKDVAEKSGGGLVNIRRADSAFAVTDFSESAMAWGQAKTNAQRWLRELEGDLLIWGETRNNQETMHLRFAQAQPFRHDRAGSLQPCDAIDLPINIDDNLSGYLYGTAIGAFAPSNKNQREAFEAILGPALDGARPAVQKKMRDLSPDEQVRFEAGFANLLACCGVAKKRGDRLQEAETTYHKALRGLKRTKSAMLGGIIKRHMGYTQAAWFEMGGEANLLEAAIESLRDAALSFTKESFPNEWADLQAAIGQLLYKKDQHEEDDTALRESIAAYQNALQVFTASSAPYRWGEAKHHLARALQLLGSQVGDLDMIARSAEACREALVVRNKNQVPMLWAATQNNLGSALFMLCQKTRKPETAIAAAKAFQSALEIYEARKAQKLVRITQKNLARAKEMVEELDPMSSNEDDEIYADFYEEDEGFEDEEGVNQP